MIFTRSKGESAGKATLQRVHDDEFGDIICRRSKLSRRVSIRIDQTGKVRASLPPRAPLYLVRDLVDSSRADIRRIVAQHQAERTIYQNNMSIGHVHKLIIETGQDLAAPKKRFAGQELVVSLPTTAHLDEPDTQEFITSAVRSALKREASAYLPRRLRYLADKFGFTYERVRFANQKGRWGSCSSSGTISLNVALMNLENDLIDYVLIHELVHTRHMNHGSEFWDTVSSCMPTYKIQRKALKSMSPIC